MLVSCFALTSVCALLLASELAGVHSCLSPLCLQNNVNDGNAPPDHPVRRAHERLIRKVRARRPLAAPMQRVSVLCPAPSVRAVLSSTPGRLGCKHCHNSLHTCRLVQVLTLPSRPALLELTCYVYPTQDQWKTE